MKRLTLKVLVSAVAIAATSAATAQAQNLTALGAEKGANAAGTIPAYEGGIKATTTGFKAGGSYADPFASDKPLFEITGANVDKYKDNLSPGQMAMLKKYPEYKLPVYQTRRTASFPKCHYDETEANAGKAKLAAGGNGITGVNGGIPFTQPKDGNEAIQSMLARYSGDTYTMHWSQAAVTREGSFALVNFEYEIDFAYGNCSKKTREANMRAYFLQKTTAPARLAGQILLVHDPADNVAKARDAWTYNPGQRRVRLAPNVAYDNPGTAADGLRTNDDFNLFGGATDRYNWKLVGKKEVYIPYNSYKQSSPATKYTDLIKPGHLDQKVARYELHRVWVVEATLKPGTSHIYSKRTIFIDEDSWMPVLVDKYDGRGELWRFAEWHSINFFNVPMHYGTVEVHHDLQSGRYIAMGLRNEEKLVYQPSKLTPNDFTPAALRGEGTR